MMEFKDIRIEDLSEIKKIVDGSHVISSLYSTYNLYALRNKYNTEISYYKENLLIRQSSRDFGSYEVYLFPIGKEGDIKECVNLLCEESGIRRHNIMFWGLTDKMLQRLNEIFPEKFIYEEIPNWSDYIYDKEELIDCKMMKKSRKFRDEYKSAYVIEEISKRNINEVLEFQNKWMRVNQSNNDDIYSLNLEHKAIIESLKKWEKLPLKGYCIKVNGGIVGFSYGFLQTSDCFIIHVIKTDKSIKGLTLFLLRILIESVETKYINFEEDIGIEGLRTFKTRLKPTFMLKKYKAVRNSEI